MTPLILLTGFLGSGKTTLLRQLIPLLAARNLAPCVILNDYRNAHLEAETLRNLTDQIVPIGGTCVCCDSRYPLMEALSSATLTDRSVMLLEANGTADAPELIELLSADPGVARYTLPVQVAVVDVQRWQKRYFHNKLERSQVPTAGYLVLTRATEVPAFRLQQVTDELAAIAPRATRQTPDTLADLMTELTLSAHHLPARRFSAGTAMPPAHHPRHRHAAQHHFSSCELRLPPRVDLEDLRTFLTGLPPEVIRAKGVAYENNAANTPWYFQKVEGRDEVTFHRIDAQIVYDPVMILIGVLINPADYRVPLAALGAAADPVP